MALTYAKLCKGCCDPVATPYTPSGSDVSGGDVIVISNNVYFATEKIADGVLGTIFIGGVWDLPQEASVAHSAGVLIYWDATNHVVTTTAGSNKKIGIVHVAAPSQTGGRVKVLSIPQAV